MHEHLQVYVYMHLYIYVYICLRKYNTCIYIYPIYLSSNRSTVYRSIDNLSIYWSIDISSCLSIYVESVSNPRTHWLFQIVETFSHRTSLYYTTIHRNTQQHTATHCNTKILKSSVRLRERAKESERENCVVFTYTHTHECVYISICKRYMCDSQEIPKIFDIYALGRQKEWIDSRGKIQTALSVDWIYAHRFC